MLAVCERSVAAGWKHYFYGEGVAELLEQTSRNAGCTRGWVEALIYRTVVLRVSQAAGKVSIIR